VPDLGRNGYVYSPGDSQSIVQLNFGIVPAMSAFITLARYSNGVDTKTCAYRTSECVLPARGVSLLIVARPPAAGPSSTTFASPPAPSPMPACRTTLSATTVCRSVVDGAFAGLCIACLCLLCIARLHLAGLLQPARGTAAQSPKAVG
jgi:hypothetical protein